jgi:hypothetical protein
VGQIMKKYGKQKKNGGEWYKKPFHRRFVQVK